jgi:hypothetical protein
VRELRIPRPTDGTVVLPLRDPEEDRRRDAIVTLQVRHVSCADHLARSHAIPPHLPHRPVVQREGGISGPEARFYLSDCDWDLARARATLQADLAWERANAGAVDRVVAAASASTLSHASASASSGGAGGGAARKGVSAAAVAPMGGGGPTIVGASPLARLVGGGGGGGYTPVPTSDGGEGEVAGGKAVGSLRRRHLAAMAGGGT